MTMRKMALYQIKNKQSLCKDRINIVKPSPDISSFLNINCIGLLHQAIQIEVYKAKYYQDHQKVTTVSKPSWFLHIFDLADMQFSSFTVAFQQCGL